MKSVACLPQSCIASIESISWKTERTKNKSIGFIDHLLDKVTMEEKGIQFLQLSSKYLIKCLGSHYLDVIQPLKEHGILETNESYIPAYLSRYGKGMSKGYKLSQQVLQGELEILDFDNKSKKYQRDKSKLVTRTKAFLRELRLPLRNDIKQFLRKTLTEEYLRKKLKFGKEVEEKHFSVNYIPKEKQYYNYWTCTSDVLNSLKENETFYKYNDKYFIESSSEKEIINYRMMIIKRKWEKDLHRLKMRDVYADRNNTNFRLDSNLTTLKSELMKLIKWDKEQLVNIDLKNSQFRIYVWFLEVLENALSGTSDFSPFSTLINNTSISKTPFLPYSLPSNMFDPICNGNTLNPSSISSFYYVNNMLLKLLGEDVEGGCKGEGFDVLSLLLLTFKELFIVKEGSNHCLSSSYVEFKELVKNGELYDEIAKRMSDKLDVEYNREQAKSLMFRIAFAKPGDNHLEKKLFKEWFPGIVAFINQFKKVCTSEYSNQGLNKEDSREKGNAAFAVSLQRIESYIFIDNILSILHQKGYKVLSKHDSVLCKESDKDVIEIEMKVVLDDIFGEGSFELKRE